MHSQGPRTLRRCARGLVLEFTGASMAKQTQDTSDRRPLVVGKGQYWQIALFQRRVELHATMRSPMKTNALKSATALFIRLADRVSQ